jgi:hypothetical protein
MSLSWPLRTGGSTTKAPKLGKQSSVSHNEGIKIEKRIFADGEGHPFRSVLLFLLLFFAKTNEMEKSASNNGRDVWIMPVVGHFDWRSRFAIHESPYLTAKETTSQ